MVNFGDPKDSFRFLDLPSELRDRIYTAVLDFEVNLPSCPEEAVDRSQPDPNWRRKGIQYECKPVDFNCTALLICNHQISSEMHYAMARGVLHKLDCMVDVRSL